MCMVGRKAGQGSEERWQSWEQSEALRANSLSRHPNYFSSLARFSVSLFPSLDLVCDTVERVIKQNSAMLAFVRTANGATEELPKLKRPFKVRPPHPSLSLFVCLFCSCLVVCLFSFVCLFVCLFVCFSTSSVSFAAYDLC